VRLPKEINHVGETDNKLTPKRRVFIIAIPEGKNAFLAIP
jgi:hypothetical protein